MTPQSLKVLEAILVEEEGEKLHAYQDHKGYWTIGVGRLIDKRRGGGISRDESRYLLANDVSRIVTEIRDRLPWSLQMSETRQIVLASMVFQMGIGSVQGFRRTLEAMKDGRYLDAARGMRESKWGRVDTPARAERMAALMEQG